MLFTFSQVIPPKDNFIALIFYSTLNVEELVETLVYDTGNFLAAAGGNLGLMLGVSCLSILNIIVYVIRAKLLRSKASD